MKLCKPRSLDTQAKELRRRAEFAYINGWYEEAVSDFLEAEKKNYQDFAVHRSLGNIFLYHRPDLPRALEYFRKAARYAAPRDSKQAAEAHLFAAYVCNLLGDHIQESIAECERAVQLNPNLLEAHYCLANYQAKAGNGSAAATSLERAIRGDARYYEQAEIDPDLKDMPEVQALLARLLTEARQSVLALKPQLTHWLDNFILPDKIAHDLLQAADELTQATTYIAIVSAIARARTSLDTTNEMHERFLLEVATLVGHTSSVKSIAFSPDGRLLASGGLDNTVRLWRHGGFPRKAEPAERTQRTESATAQRRAAGQCEECGTPLGFFDKLRGRTRCGRCR